MSWEPNTEENETRKTRDNLEDLKQAQFFSTSSINSASITNSMGTSSNMSGFNFDVMGDIVEGITNTFVGGLGELYKILSGYVFITPDASETNNTAVINKIGNGTGNTVDKANLPQDGQLLTLRPEAGKSLTLINSVKTGLSSAGNLLLGSDITLTESESITLRYQNLIKYADAINGVSENIGGWIVHSTGNGAGSSAWVDTATSPLNMDGNAIFFDLKVDNKMSILYNGSNLNYTVDVNGGAHNFYVDDLVLPKFGITETSIESNVRLDMNLNYVEFQEISTPSTPTTNHGFIYAKDVGGVTTPMWSNSAGETSLLVNTSGFVTLAGNNNFTGINSFTNITGSFTVSTPTVSLGTGSGSINLLGVLASSGDLQINDDVDLLVHKIKGITALWYDSTGTQSVYATSGGIGIKVPTADTIDFFVNSTSTPKLGITELSVESNVRLNVNNQAIFFDGTSLKSSILYLSNALNYIVDINGGSHDFFVDDLVTPKFGITETSIESNEALNMNGHSIYWDTGLTYGLVGGSSAGGMDFQIPSTINHSFDFQVGNGAGGLGIPQFAITDTSVESNVYLDMNGMHIYFDGSTYSIAGSSGAGGMDFQIPSTSGYAFDFQLGTGVGGLPQMGISNTEVGLNVPLDMNLSYIKFQAITGVSAPTGLEKRFLFSDSANLDHLSVRTTSGIVDLESGGAGGTSFIGFTADDDLNMGTFDVTNIDRVLFNQTSGSPLSSTQAGITSDNTPDMHFNLTGSGDFYRFHFGGSAVTEDTNIGTGGIQTNNLTVAHYITMNASSQTLIANGMMNRNSSGDVQVYSGGAIRNMSDIGVIGANDTLSNLSYPTAIQQTLIPDLDNTYSLGTSSIQWRDLHIDGTAYLDAIGFGTDSCTLPTNNGSNGEVLTTNGSGTLTWSTPSSSGANTSLSNLSYPTAIDQTLIPDLDNLYSLGTSSIQWRDLYIDGTAYLDAIGFGSQSMTLPTSNGTNGQVLTTNGTTSLSWTTPSSGSSGANTSLSNLTSTGESHFVKLGNTSNWTAEQQFNAGIDLGSDNISGVDAINYGVNGGTLNFSSQGYIQVGGSTKLTFNSSGGTFGDSVIFQNSTQFNSSISLTSGDIYLSSGTTISFSDISSSATAGGASLLPSRPTGYFTVKYGSNTRKIPYYS